ncbi:MAG: hypothetical protein VYB33_02620, partial [Pseudomonadota bacterium]|nr:hypothetical protein [Pseudomonadota bacterium]
DTMLNLGRYKANEFFIDFGIRVRTSHGVLQCSGYTVFGAARQSVTGWRDPFILYRTLHANTT